MIQRFLFKTLKSALEAVAKDDTILDMIFGELYEFEAEEVASIKEVFQKLPPKVIHNYARSDQKPPFFSIVLATEGETTQFIGDDGQMIDDETDELYGADEKSAIWSHTFQIHCYSEHPDVTLYIYEFAKAVFLTNRTLYQEGGDLFGYRLSGMDLVPDPRYIPENLFGRQLTFTAEREFLQVDVASKIGKAFKVAGIHVDKSGSPSDVGGVKTLVTVSGEGE